MAIKLLGASPVSDIILNQIDFIEEDYSYFKISNDKGKEIVINYVPIVDSSWDPAQFDIYLFENPYLNAENDVFEVYHSELTERLGWIFPIRVLVSNENEYENYRNLNKYKFVTYFQLLNKDIEVSINNATDVYQLTDLYNDSLIICVLNKNTTLKIEAFQIDDYLISFYSYGYTLFSEVLKSTANPNRMEIVSNNRGIVQRIRIKKPGYNISSNNYILALFKEHLVKESNGVVRFIFLYQIFEQLMDEEFDMIFNNHLDNYQQSRIAKNDLKEYISEALKERKLIKSILSRIPVDVTVRHDFEQECSYLFQAINHSVKDGFSDKLYDFRNIMTHRLRDILNHHSRLNVIVSLFEKVIIDTLLNYTLISN